LHCGWSKLIENRSSDQTWSNNCDKSVRILVAIIRTCLEATSNDMQGCVAISPVVNARNAGSGEENSPQLTTWVPLAVDRQFAGSS
jgi:hypothetical protein